jgi:hypothetical protein
MSYRRSLLERQADSLVYILKFDDKPAWDKIIAVINELISGAHVLSDAEIVSRLNSLEQLPPTELEAPLNPLAVNALARFRERMFALWLNQPSLRDALYEVYFAVQLAANELYRPDERKFVLEVNDTLDKLLELVEPASIERSKVPGVLSTLAAFFERENLASTEFTPRALRWLNRAEVEFLLDEVHA